MNQYRWDTVEKEPISPLITRQAIYGETMTLARFEVRKGGTVPNHSHHNEQITTVHGGRVRFLLDGKEVILQPGESLHIPANLPHSAEALEDSLMFEVFSPPRHDWLKK
jgi:quercetin dioxygenase-like cupin family protein